MAGFEPEERRSGSTIVHATAVLPSQTKGATGLGRSPVDIGERLTSNTTPLIAALLVPPRPPAPAARQRHVSLMEARSQSPIVLVSGEPASGKTSLVLQWIDSISSPDRPVAWLTIRPKLNDTVLFWRYLLAVVETLGVVTDDLAGELTGGDSPSERWLTVLANRLVALPGRSTIVLDDFHELTSSEVVESFEAFVGMVPGPPHFVILTRSRPSWPLTLWHVSGRLAEIDSVDLKLTIEESRAMVGAAGVDPDDRDVERLLARTEGWAGGIRFALLSMRHANDANDFIARFASDDELGVADLFREVLDDLDPDVRSFLLDCSILDQLTPEVCDSLRGRSDSHRLLGRCARENLFVTRLQGSRDAYHVHGMLSDFLTATLRVEDPERLTELNRIASVVFERTGEIGLAISHAVVGDDYDRVGSLIVQHGFEHVGRGDFDTIRSWLLLLREARATDSPTVTLALASTLMFLGRLGEAHELLDEIDEIEGSPSLRHATLQQRALLTIKGGQLDSLDEVSDELAAASSLAAGDSSAVAQPFDPSRFSIYVASLAALFRGDSMAACAGFESLRHSTSFVLFSVEAPGWLARLAYADGQLELAKRLAKESLDRHRSQGSGRTALVVPAYLAMADVAWERNELDRAEELVDQARLSVRPLWWEMVLVQLSASRLLASRGQLDEARDQLIHCGQTYLAGYGRAVLRSMLCDALIDLAWRSDDLNEAHRWIAARSEWTERPLSLTSQLQLGFADGAQPDVACMQKAVATETRAMAIDALLTGATLAIRSGNERIGHSLVAEAASHAEGAGMIRRFVDASYQVRAAIRVLAANPMMAPTSVVSPFFLASMVEALDAEGKRQPSRASLSDELVEQLTGRELEVLELLSTAKTYREVGSALFISRNTVKSHVRRIYTKLGVVNREAAIREGRRLGLI